MKYSVIAIWVRSRYLQNKCWSHNMFHFSSVCDRKDMFGPRIRITPVIRNEHQRNLEWSMRPIFLWLHILGIPSNLLQTAIRRYIFLFFGVTLMVWMSSSHIQFILDYVQYALNINLSKLPFEVSNNELRIHSLNQLQDHCNTILICLSLFVVSHLQWESLWKNACEIEQAMKLDGTFFCSLRKIINAAVILLTVVRAGNCESLSFSKKDFEKTPFIYGFRKLLASSINTPVGRSLLKICWSIPIKFLSFGR